MIILAQGAVDTFTDPLGGFYEALEEVCMRTSDVLQVIAFVIIFTGLLMQVYKGMIGGDLAGMFRHILVSGVILAIAPHYLEWMLSTRTVLGEDMLQAMEVDPMSALTNFGESFADAPFDTGSAPDIILGVLDPIAWGQYFLKIIGLYLMVGLSIIMYALFWLGFQVQKIAIYLGSACAPIFLAMLVFEQTKDTGVKYHIGLISICFWPLGWGLGMVFTEAMMTDILPQATVICAIIFGPLMAEPITQTVVTIGAVIIILLIIIVWLIVVLFAAPKIVSKAITTGANIGMGLVSAAASTAMGVGSAGVQAASGAAMMVGGAAITAGTGGAGAAVGMGMMASGAGSMGGAAGGVAKTASSAGDK